MGEAKIRPLPFRSGWIRPITIIVESAMLPGMPVGTGRTLTFCKGTKSGKCTSPGRRFVLYHPAFAIPGPSPGDIGRAKPLKCSKADRSGLIGQLITPGIGGGSPPHQKACMCAFGAGPNGGTDNFIIAINHDPKKKQMTIAPAPT